jgi:two-component system, OmpR family, sensor histidine kinase TctE
VKEVMKAHGGWVEFAFPSAGGFAVTLVFPNPQGDCAGGG